MGFFGSDPVHAEKSTVRSRKKTALVSTQRFLPIAEIRNDTVMLKNGGLRAVLQVEALNFNLKSEMEQQGIIAGYEGLVNTLSFPLQIVVRSSKMNIDPYLIHLRKLGETQQNPLLKSQTFSYANFVEHLIDVADIMQKRFYVVVPFDQSARHHGLLEQFFSWISPDDSATKAAQRSRDFAAGSHGLKDRVTLVQAGLENIGLRNKRMSTHELIELYYQIYNPRASQEQKLPADDQLKVDRTTL